MDPVLSQSVVEGRSVDAQIPCDVGFVPVVPAQRVYQTLALHLRKRVIKDTGWLAVRQWADAEVEIIPGCGHFYLGHNLKGFGFIVGIVGFQLFDLGLDATVIGLSLGVPLELGPGALYVFSIVDAYRIAKHMEPARA